MENLSIEKIQAGDEDALKDLFTALLPRVRHMVFKHSGHLGRELVDDIVQETIIKIYSNIQKFNGQPDMFWAWCNFIARNVALNVIRASYHRSDRFQTIEDTSSSELPVIQPTVDSVRLFKEAIELLSEKQKQIVTLRVKGLTFEEIAVLLNENKTRLRANYYRAISKLKHLLLTNEGTSEEVGK